MDVHVLADRPDLGPAVDALAPRLWPEFMRHDPVGEWYYGDLDPWLDHVLVGVLDGEVVARGFSVGFPLEDEDDLPADGWDGVIRRAVQLRRRGGTPDVASALEIGIVPELRGEGLSAVMVDALRRNAAALGYPVLYAPVRPSRKADEPGTPIADYAWRTRDDGLPADPWLRVHVRAGAQLLRVAPTSMVISGTLDDWRGWTGLPFDTSGPVHVPGALVAVHVEVEQDHAVYVEPNVWVRHSL